MYVKRTWSIIKYKVLLGKTFKRSKQFTMPETECADGNNIHNDTKFSSRNDDLLNNEITFMFNFFLKKTKTYLLLCIVSIWSPTYFVMLHKYVYLQEIP